MDKKKLLSFRISQRATQPWTNKINELNMAVNKEMTSLNFLIRLIFSFGDIFIFILLRKRSSMCVSVSEETNSKSVIFLIYLKNL